MEQPRYRDTGEKQEWLADVLTLSRATTGAVLAGLVASGIRDRTGTAGRLSWSMLLLGVTALDWLDGPLARHAGATRLGSVLDIEADSWLTLWSAACATAWGDLPRWCLLPPILRYLNPLLDLRRGKLPRGGGRPLVEPPDRYRPDGPFPDRSCSRRWAMV